MSLRAHEEPEFGRRLDDLLDQLRLQGDRPDGPDRVVSWLARHLAADLAELLPGAPAPGPGSGPAPRLFPIGRPVRAVLALRRAEPFGAAEMRLIAHAETVLDRLLQARAAAAERVRLREVSASLRVAAFQLLMGGQTTLARRTVAPLAPGVLVHEQARVYLVDCGAAERDRAGEQLGAALAGRALVVRCPANEGHLIVLGPVAPRTVLDTHGWCPTGLALREGLTGIGGHSIGGSTTVELARTADAYREAFNALAVARRLPQRHALYQGQTRLAQLLDARAGSWAEHLLHPVLVLPRGQREEAVETARLALAFSHGQTGLLLDVHRNTVARRIERASGALGLDWGSFRDRAVLDLALQLLVHDRPPVPVPEVPLAAVLDGEAARAWSRSFLDPLAGDRRPLLRTLAAWVRAGANARDTQAALGLHHQTVLDHLRTAERLLQRELTGGRSGAYELAWALWIDGAVPVPRS
ncbi:helix-turn-helix domain-containing protein [Kitasatospora sp. NPDC058965]|uniref:helix-turn-helix domain-containing protein n=1 Tax=Kitasatospora sp. NPDC058965 TaxID=3346682 RepID=UPI0036C19162